MQLNLGSADQMQVKLVLEKMAVVQALHDGLRVRVDELNTDINRGTITALGCD